MIKVLNTGYLFYLSLLFEVQASRREVREYEGFGKNAIFQKPQVYIYKIGQQATGQSLVSLKRLKENFPNTPKSDVDISSKNTPYKM